MVGGVHDAEENMSILCSERQAEMRLRKRREEERVEQTQRNPEEWTMSWINNGGEVKNERGRS